MGVCVHRWECDPPLGKTSRGVCTLCGETQQFHNHLRGEQAESLPWERGPAYLPQVKQVTRLEVTEEPEVEHPVKSDGQCSHFWRIGDPDERGLAHIRCHQCGLEWWCDEEGILYDANGDRLPYRKQVMHVGEFGRRYEKGKRAERSEMGNHEDPAKLPKVKQWVANTPKIAEAAEHLGMDPHGLQCYLSRHHLSAKKLRAEKFRPADEPKAGVDQMAVRPDPLREAARAAEQEERLKKEFTPEPPASPFMPPGRRKAVQVEVAFNSTTINFESGGTVVILLSNLDLFAMTQKDLDLVLGLRQLIEKHKEEEVPQ